MTSETYILSRIEALEEELAQLKSQVKAKKGGGRTIKSLYGILGDVDFTPEEIDAVKESWHSKEPE